MTTRVCVVRLLRTTMGRVGTTEQYPEALDLTGSPATSITAAGAGSTADDVLDAVDHGLLPLADLLGPEAEKAALLGGVGSRLRRAEEPGAEGCGLPPL